MPMKRISTLLIGLAMAGSIAAQTHPQQQDSISKAIVEGRQLVKNLILDDDKAELTKAMRERTVEAVAGSDRQAFTPREYLITLYLTREYDRLLDYTAHLDAPRWQFLAATTPPPQDGLLDYLTKSSSRSKASAALSDFIQAHPLDLAQNEMLSILLEWLLTDNTGSSLHKQIAKAHAYGQRYPDSPYRRFLSDYSQNAIETSGDWLRSQSLGVGLHVPLGKMSKLWQLSPSLLLNLEAFYQDLYLGGGLRYSFGAVKKPFLQQHYQQEAWYQVLPDSHSLRELAIDLRMGCRIVNNAHITLTPYLCTGLGRFVIHFKESAGEDPINKPLFGCGVMCDLKIKSSQRKGIAGSQGSYRAVRFRYQITSANYPVSTIKTTTMQTLSIEFATMWSPAKWRGNR